MSFQKAYSGMMNADPSAANEFRKALRVIANAGKDMTGSISDAQKAIRALQVEKKNLLIQTEEFEKSAARNRERVAQIDIEIAAKLESIQSGDVELREALQKLQQFAVEIGE